MKIKNISLQNIGPFNKADISFNIEADSEGNEPITIITGVNGSGKSIVIDAIRASFSGDRIERDIVADANDFFIGMNVKDEENDTYVYSHELSLGRLEPVNVKLSNLLLYGYSMPEYVHPWVIDYWSSKSPTDSFEIETIKNIKHEEVLKEVMFGRKSNVQLVNFLCHVDYLRSSDVDSERELGESLFSNIKHVINQCLDNGEFKYIRRSDLTPIVIQNSHEVSLDKLSSGNIFLIEHLVLLMCKMYSVCVLRKDSPADMLKYSGLLLIDEIENHLHPKWQKKILGIIRSLFPNLQIILTTHSPFVVASARGAKIYTCKPIVGGSVIEDETDMYNHMTVEEVLLSDVFNVNPFNDEITEIMHKRQQLIEEGRVEDAKEIEKELFSINPEYFSYLNV